MLVSAPPIASDLYVIRRPWTAFEPHTYADYGRDTSLLLGDVLALRFPRSAKSAWSAFASDAPALRRAFPAQPIVFWTCSTDMGDVLSLDRLAALHGVRCVLAGGTRDPDLLRRRLSDRCGLADDVVRWCIDTGVLPDSEIAWHVHRIIEMSSGMQTVEHISRAAGLSPRTLRDRFARAGVPAPRAFVALARALRGALELQAETDDEPRDAGEPKVFAEHLVRAAFGLSVRRIHMLLGIAPLLHLWSRRSGRST